MALDIPEILSDIPDFEAAVMAAVDGVKAAKADGKITTDEILDLELAINNKVNALLKKIIAQAAD